MILTTAKQLVDEREKKYGTVETSFESVARAFNELCNPRAGLCAQDIALIQILLKLKRAQVSPENLDHYVDIAGYAEIMARLK
jgi:hypothetical protein